MIDRRLVTGLVLLLVAPSIAGAQRGRGNDRGTRAPDWDKLSKGEPTTLVSKKDLEAMDPVRYLIAKRKDLKLTDEQVAKLKEMDEAAKARDAAHFQALDSLRKEMKSGQVDDVQRLRNQVVRREFAATVAKVRANYEMSAKEVVPVLEETQRPTAEELLAKQKAEADEVV